MNIKRAKQEIKDTIEAYLLKDEYGEYVIPDPSAAGAAARCTWYRKDPDHGADRAGVPSRACLLYNHASYETECDRPAVYFKKGVWRQRVFRDGIYDE